MSPALWSSQIKTQPFQLRLSSSIFYLFKERKCIRQPAKLWMLGHKPSQILFYSIATPPAQYKKFGLTAPAVPELSQYQQLCHTKEDGMDALFEN